MSHFADELRDLINRKCREKGSNTPDFILGEFLWRCLDAFDAAVRERDVWYKHNPMPQHTTAAGTPLHFVDGIGLVEE